MHDRRESKTKGTTPFGVRIPDWMLHEFEAARTRYRPDLEYRQDAVIEAMQEWAERQRPSPVDEYIEQNREAA